MVRITSTVLMVFLLCNHAFADTTGSICGSVIDMSTRNSISNVTIQLSGIDTPVVTDDKGEFLFPDVQPGRYELNVSHVGYREISRSISVVANDTAEISILLDPEAVPVEGVTVTATRFSEDEFSLPTAVSITSHREFNERSLSTTADLLREEPGVLVQKTTAGHGAPILRGLIGKHVLLLYDGIRLNKPTFRFGANQYLNTISHESLSRIEVVRGPSSVMYGSDAIGGVVNLIPRLPDVDDSGLSVTPQAKAEYASADDRRSLNAGFVAGYGDFWSSIGATYEKTADLRAGKHVGVQKPTGWEEFNFDSRFAFMVGEGHSISVDYLATRQNRVPRYDKYVSGDFEEYVYDPQDRDLIGLSYQAENPGRAIASLKCNLSYQYELEGKTTRKTGSSAVTRNRDRVTTWGGYLQASLLPLHDHWLSFGCEYYSDRVRSESHSLENGVVSMKRPAFPDESSYRSFGVFASDEYSLSDKSRLRLGLRYSRFGLDTPLGEPFGDVEETYDNLTGSVSLSYTMNDHLNLIGRWSRGFRAPNLNDVSVLKFSSSGVDAPSTGLEPEKSSNFELGIKMRNDLLIGSLFGFYNRLSDLIDRVPGAYDGKDYFDDNGNGVRDSNEFDIYQRRNVDESYVCGIEFDNKLAISDIFSLRINFFWTYGENQIDGEPLSRIPPLMGMLALRMSRGSGWIEAFVRAAGSQRRLSARDVDDTRIDENGTPSWATVNLRSKVSIGWLTLHAAIENITDTTYKEHGSGVYSPGRNFRLSVSYSGL